MSLIRAEKVSSVIKQILSTPIINIAFENKAGLATVTSVRLSSDLHIAKIYVSIYGGSMLPLKFLEILDDNSKMLRSIVGSNLRLRFTPELKFFLDDTLDQMEHIQKLLDSVKTKNDS